VEHLGLGFRRSIRRPSYNFKGSLGAYLGDYEASRTPAPDVVQKTSPETPSGAAPWLGPTDTSVLSELPRLSSRESWSPNWDLIEGLHAKEVPSVPVVPGQPVLRLVAVPTENRHAVAVRFGGLAPNRVYRATVWIRALPGTRVVMEARDGLDPGNGRPFHFGTVSFDLAAHKPVQYSGDLRNHGAEAAADAWQMLWMDLPSKDGLFFVLVGLLEGDNNLHIFKGAGQEMTLGGFEVGSPKS
jgi:hypothetical protein